MDKREAEILISVLIDIKDELKTTNQRLIKVENALDRIYGGLP